MIKTAETYHVPVLLKESVDGLNIQPGGIYVDVTFGGGGHSREILSRLTEGAHLYSFDQDADAERNVVANENFTFVCSNFRFLKNWMRYYGVDGLDGLLADLGVSSHHILLQRGRNSTIFGAHRNIGTRSKRTSGALPRCTRFKHHAFYFNVSIHTYHFRLLPHIRL